MTSQHIVSKTDRHLLKSYTFSFDTDWQHFLKLESSLNQLLQNPQNYLVTHDKLNNIVGQLRQLVSLVETIKMQRKSYASMMQTSRSIQAKLQNHNSIVQSIEQSYAQRIKQLNEELKATREQVDKNKKQQKQKVQAVEKELNEMRQQIKFLEEKLRQQEKITSEYQKKTKDLKEQIKLNEVTIDKLTKSQQGQELPKPKSATMSQFLTSNINHHLVAYLQPKQLLKVMRLNKTIRQCVIGSRKCVISMLRSVKSTGDLRLKIYKKHIHYFEEACEKIPEEMIQTAFYKYMILKKKPGDFILPVLNSCALLFQGKFVQVSIEKDINFDEKAEIDLIHIDGQVKQQYQEETRLNKETANEQVQIMYKRIHNTAQLYSADVESIGLFLNNLEKNYSRLFVASKMLTTDAKYLQILNSYLLSMLADRHHTEVLKNSELQDMKAQLESQARIKNFFSTKAIHAEQRALALENESLKNEMRSREASTRLIECEKQLKNLQLAMQQLDRKNQVLVRDNKSLKQNFQLVSSKYKAIIQELQLLQDTLIQMKIN